MTLAERPQTTPPRNRPFPGSRGRGRASCPRPGGSRSRTAQRQASEKLIDKLTGWLVADKHIRAGTVAGLRNELLTLKYLGSRSPFVRMLAESHADDCGLRHLSAPSTAAKPKRGRPALARTRA